MADTKDYYVQNCHTLLPQGSVQSGGFSVGVSIIILSGVNMNSTLMANNIQSIITDYYSSYAQDSAVGDMTHWCEGAAATACVYTGLNNAFDPNGLPSELYSWVKALGNNALNFEFGLTTDPSGPGTGTAISPGLMSQQVAITQVKTENGLALETNKLAIIVSTPSYRENNTAYYRGVTKVAIRVLSSACPETVSVEAWPAILKANCVTGENEMMLPSLSTIVGSC